MARNHGKILTRIWQDEDFTALNGLEQRLYMFLVTQPDLSFAGVLPLRPKKWAGKASRLTVAGLQKQLDILEAERFVVTDDDTGELLIRTFIRNDEVWKLPKVMVRVREDVALVESRALQSALLDEMPLIPLDLLKNDPGANGGPSTRKAVEAIVDAIRHGLEQRLQGGG